MFDIHKVPGGLDLMSASMKDVAKRASVSISTVSHVINKTRKVNPETKEKVQQAIIDLEYNVNPVARTLRSGSSKTIGVVVSNLSNAFFLDIALSIDKVLKAHGYGLIYINSNEEREIEKENIQNLMMQNVDGLIIAPVEQDCSYMESLIGSKCPSVFFDRFPGGFKKDCIMSTNFEGAFDGTKLLIEKGHQKIGFIGSHLDGTMSERIEGYKEALHRSGLAVDDALIKTGSGGSQFLKNLKNGDGNKLARYLVQEQKVTAFLCGNDLSAVGAVSFLLQNNYRFPEDVAIVTFDDAFWLSMTSPSITAIDQDSEVIGTTAAKVLLDRINKVGDPVREYRIPTKLIVRSSC